MAKEIERKYLVPSTVWMALEHREVAIKQGYLSKSKKHVVRIRTSGKKAFITIKGPKVGFTCDEYEYSIPFEDAEKMLLMCDGPIIDKVRHILIDEHGQRWEIDFFHGINHGLIMAEIELSSETDQVILPEWIGAEVTFDRRYTNTYLATHQVPTE